MIEQKAPSPIYDAFKENRLLGRASVEGEKIPGQEYDFSKFKEELNFVLNTFRPTPEAPSDPTQYLYPASSTLIVPQVPMFMFGPVGFLYDAAQSNVLEMWLQDAFTDLDEEDFGSTMAGFLKTQNKNSDPDSLLQAFASEMYQFYQNFKNNKLPDDFLWENPPCDGMLSHNELKINLFKESLLGIYYQQYSNQEYFCLMPHLKEGTISKAWLDDYNKVRLLFVYHLQKSIITNFKIDLPIFFFDSKTGSISHWSPTPNEIDDLLTFEKKIEEQAQFFEILESADAKTIEEFLTNCRYWNREELIKSREFNLRGQTPLIKAIGAGNLLAAKKIIELGVGPESDFQRNSVVRYAMECSNEELAVFLIEKFKFSTEESESSLRLSAQKGSLLITTALLDKGASVTLESVLAAIKNGHIKLANYLLSKGEFGEYREAEFFAMILGNNKSKNDFDNNNVVDNFNPAGDRKSIFSKEFKMAIKSKDQKSFKSLLICMRDSLESLDDISIYDNYDTTPILIYAMEQHWPWAVSTLLDEGANPEITQYGMTPLEIINDDDSFASFREYFTKPPRTLFFNHGKSQYRSSGNDLDYNQSPEPQ